jgi:hypothetical protein
VCVDERGALVSNARTHKRTQDSEDEGSEDEHEEDEDKQAGKGGKKEDASSPKDAAKAGGKRKKGSSPTSAAKKPKLETPAKTGASSPTSNPFLLCSPVCGPVVLL